MTGERGEVSMGSAMIPGARHDEAVDPSAPTPRADRFYREPPADAVAGARGILLGLVECYRTPVGDKPFGTHPLSRDTLRGHLERALHTLETAAAEQTTAELREIPATGLTAEQEIRARALEYASRLVGEWGFDGLDPATSDALDIAVAFGRYIATGDITPATLDDLDVPDEAPVLTRAAGQPRAYQRTTVDQPEAPS